MEKNFSENAQPNQLNQPVRAQQPKKIFWIFFTASVLIAFLAGGYFLAGKQNRFVVQNQQKIITSPTPLPTEAPAKAGDPTASWKTYVDPRYGFEIKYPLNLRTLQTNNYTLPALNTSRDIVIAIQSINREYPKSLTGLDVFVNNDMNNCLLSSNGQKVTETKDINGIVFLVYGENVPDDAMGGMRSVNNNYRVFHNSMCYSVLSSVFWQDIQYKHDVTDLKKANAQELEEEQNWILTQQQLNDQILSTFKFTDQNQVNNLSPSPFLKAKIGVAPTLIPVSSNWLSYKNPNTGISLRYPPGWKKIEDAVDPYHVELRLYPPESNPDIPSASISLFNTPELYSDGSNPSNRLVYKTSPKPISVDGVTGIKYDDASFAIPLQTHFIDLPYRGGTLSITATMGPDIDLGPQLEEILKTVKLQP